MSMFVKGESRKLVFKDRQYQDKSWTEYNLKIEMDNGTDVLIQVPKQLVTEENIEYLKSLKGQEIEAAFWVNHRDKYLTYYLSELPKIKE
ncbi:hypothetical protein VSVS12_02728 [Vibrio scophthalmi]|uniref:hypothetical protein n=1 Tax=Vibrio scophthalmi TaxID=45658 RepID=UPI0008097825|nr:hypothetical protein [Vibrio scophthalmi]ANS86477.1 hypothetical protein VSVS12_02728 [Vibrio scophthalmi]